MFLNPIWSILLIVAVIALYVFVIRPRLQAKFTELYTDIESFWGRLLARLYAFRSYFATVLATVLIALPDIAVALTPLDFSGLIGPNYAKMVAAGLAIYLAVNRAYATKPGEEQ